MSKYTVVTCAAAALTFIAASASAQQIAPPSVVHADGPVISMSLHSDHSAVAYGDNDATFMVQLAGHSDDVEQTRTPVSIAIVMDTSGSMNGDKINDAREAARAVVAQLQPGDYVSVISYSDGASILLANHQYTGDPSTANNAINGLYAQGSTCISCGLESAYGLLTDTPLGYTGRVVMLSDGNANAGVVDGPGLRRMASWAFEYNVPTSTVGLGNDYNESLMSEIANGGGGGYYFLPNSNAIAGVLERELDTMTSTIATSVAVRLTPGDGVTLDANAVPGSVADGRDLIIQIGQFSAGQGRQLVVPATLPDGALGNAVTATLEYTTTAGGADQLMASASLLRTTDPMLVESSLNTAVLVRTQTLASATVISGAIDSWGAGDSGGAIADLRSVQQQMRNDAIAFDAPELEVEAANIDMLLEDLESNDYEEDSDEVEELGRQNRARQREMEGGASADDMYHAAPVAH